MIYKNGILLVGRSDHYLVLGEELALVFKF